jgi:hypothetical protein
MCFIFVGLPIADLKMADIRDADPKYANFLLDVVFQSNTTASISLRSLGEYSTYTTIPKGVSLFGFTQVLTSTSKPRILSIFQNPIVKKYLLLPSFVGLNYKKIVLTPIVFASPLWIFQHNLHMLDESVCGNATMLQNVQRSTTFSAVTGDIMPWDGLGRACVPATPTAVDYELCYENLSRHRYMIATQAILWTILLVAHSIVMGVYPKRSLGKIDPRDWTRILQAGALITVISLELFEWSHGIGNVVSMGNLECPDKQTGLLVLYQCLFAGHFFKWMSLISLLWIMYL